MHKTLEHPKHLFIRLLASILLLDDGTYSQPNSVLSSAPSASLSPIFLAWLNRQRKSSRIIENLLDQDEAYFNKPVVLYSLTGNSCYVITRLPSDLVHISLIYQYHRVPPKKDARFSKLKYIPDLLSNDR